MFVDGSNVRELIAMSMDPEGLWEDQNQVWCFGGEPGEIDRRCLVVVDDGSNGARDV